MLSRNVVFLNPRTCGVNKDGGRRYKVDPITGRRSREVDNELLAHVEQFVCGKTPDGMVVKDRGEVLRKGILVPRYYDERWDAELGDFLRNNKLSSTTLGHLEDKHILFVRGGHGSPGNDQRLGSVPYVKVSDIRALRVNVNPTNLIPDELAERIWRGPRSGLQAWDLVTPNRASSNIGEFAVLLPGEERIVLTKEVFVFRLKKDDEVWDRFYLLWSLCLRCVRREWQRITLMQTNREDVAERYREIRVPLPPSPAWAKKVSAPFREYFTSMAEAKAKFTSAVKASGFEYIANVYSAGEPSAVQETDEPAGAREGGACESLTTAPAQP